MISLRRGNIGNYLMVFLFVFGPMFVSQVSKGGAFTAELDRTEGTLEDYFLLTITIEGELTENLSLPTIDGLSFYVKNSQQSTQNINGQWSKKIHYVIAVQPQKTGTFVIPSLQLTVDGEKISTLPLTLTIKDSASHTPQAVPSTQGNQQVPQDESQTTPKAATSLDSVNDQIQEQQRLAFKNLEKTGGVFIHRECEPKEVYVGQQIRCLVRIFHPGNLNSGQKVPENSADFRRFSPEGEKRDQQVINGRRFALIELGEIFVPIKEGTLRIPSFQLDAQVVSWEQRKNPLDKFFDRFGGGMFDFDFSFPDTKMVRVTHPENSVEVKPLPLENKPQNFKSIVGNFQMSATLSKNQVAAGDTATLTVTLAGEGVLDTAMEPSLTLDPSIKVYTDKPEYSERVDLAKGVQAQRVFKMALVPSKQGTFTLGKIEIPIFDPTQTQYRVLTQDLGPLIVTPGQVEEKLYRSTSPVAAVQQQVKQLAQDLFGPHGVGEMTISDRLGVVEQRVLGCGITLSFLAPLVSLVYMRNLRRRQEDIGGIRRSRAYRSFKAKVGEARQRIEAGDAHGGISGIYQGFREYLGDLNNAHGKALTLRDMEGIFNRSMPSKDQVAGAVDLMSRLERVEFRGERPDSQEALRWLSEIERLAGELDQ